MLHIGRIMYNRNNNILKERFCLIKIIVREATEKASKIIASIGVASWQAAYRDIISDEYLNSLSVEGREKHIINSIANPTNRFAIAELDEEPVGMICFYPLSNDAHAKREWEIKALYVLPQYWNKGIGRALIQYAFQYMVANKGEICNLWVLADNQNARKFYERMGMSFTGKEKTITIDDRCLIEVNYQIHL